MWKQQLVYQHTQTAAQWTLTHCAHSFLPRIMSPRSPSLHLCLTRMSVSVHNLSVCHPLRRGTSWPSMAATGRKLTCSTSRQTSRWGVCLMRGRNKSAAEWSVLECVRVLFSVCCHVCARWVALSSPGLSAGSVGFGAECDVAADPLSCGSLSISLSLPLCPCVSQGRVVENISKRCGGFLRQLSLRGCLSVGDASMKWDTRRVSDTHWCNKCGSTLTFSQSLVGLKFKHLVLLQSQGSLWWDSFFFFIPLNLTVLCTHTNENNRGEIVVSFCFYVKPLDMYV